MADEDIEGGTKDGGGDALDFPGFALEDWVTVEVGGQVGVGDGMVDEEGESPTALWVRSFLMRV